MSMARPNSFLTRTVTVTSVVAGPKVILVPKENFTVPSVYIRLISIT